MPGHVAARESQIDRQCSIDAQLSSFYQVVEIMVDQIIFHWLP